MSKLGTFLTVKVDPASNGGFDVAPALVTGEHEDGSLRVRVLGATSTDDTVRNYVGDDGEPFDYPDAQQPAAPTSAPAAPAEPSVPTPDELAQYTPEERAQLLAELQQLDDAQPPSADGTPGAGA